MSRSYASRPICGQPSDRARLRGGGRRAPGDRARTPASPAFQASRAALITSTFSCDTAYSSRPTALRASARSRYTDEWSVIRPSRTGDDACVPFPAARSRPLPSFCPGRTTRTRKKTNERNRLRQWQRSGSKSHSDQVSRSVAANRKPQKSPIPSAQERQVHPPGSTGGSRTSYSLVQVVARTKGRGSEIACSSPSALARSGRNARTASTFSCDIAYSSSPTASRASP